MDSEECPDARTLESQEQFAAALTAKLGSLTETAAGEAGRGSPEVLGLGDYENPDSMETQGDALCVSGPPSPLGSLSECELAASPVMPIPDCDPDTAFTSALLPTFGPLPDPASDPIFDDSMMGNIFNDDPDMTQESGDVTNKDATPGMCGLRNIGNTCFMNSGLQCIIASPTIVEYFLHFNPDLKVSNNESEDKDSYSKENSQRLDLSKQFAGLLQQVYSGKYSIIQPNSFKETLSNDHSQFQGFRQHDCQEFLALLLDSLHEQLVTYGAWSRGRGGQYSLSGRANNEISLAKVSPLLTHSPC